MVELLVFTMIVYGLSNMVVYASGPFEIFSKLRDWSEEKLPSNLGEMFHCMICFPTWVGIGLSLLNIFVFNDYYFTPFNMVTSNTHYWYINIFMDGFAASGINWFVHTIQEYFENNNINDVYEEE